MSNVETRYLEWHACRRDFGCVLDDGHEGDCDLLTNSWADSGLPDPHRHNPFAVGVVVVLAFVAWSTMAVLILAMIFGWVGH